MLAVLYITLLLTFAAYLTLRFTHHSSTSSVRVTQAQYFGCILMGAIAQGAWVFLIDRMFWGPLLLVMGTIPKVMTMLAFAASSVGALSLYANNQRNHLYFGLAAVLAMITVGTATHLVWFLFSQL